MDHRKSETHTISTGIKRGTSTLVIVILMLVFLMLVYQFHLASGAVIANAVLTTGSYGKPHDINGKYE